MTGLFKCFTGIAYSPRGEIGEVVPVCVPEYLAKIPSGGAAYAFVCSLEVAKDIGKLWEDHLGSSKVGSEGSKVCVCGGGVTQFPGKFALTYGC